MPVDSISIFGILIPSTKWGKTKNALYAMQLTIFFLKYNAITRTDESRNMFKSEKQINNVV